MASVMVEPRASASSGFPQPLKLTATTSGYLDAIRALASLAVMFGHWRGLFFVDYPNIEPANTTSAVKTRYALTGFGHQAVMIFFVLSGFFVSSSILRRLTKSDWSWRDYAIDRGVRLYVVLLPGLVLGFFWDFIGSHYCNAAGIYSAPLIPFGDGIVSEQLTWTAFFGNLLFLQSGLTTVFGSNGPLWSLFNEFWYYVLFPVLLSLILAAQRRSIKAICGYSAVAVLSAALLGSQLSGFLVWLAGFLIALTARHWAFGNSRKFLAAAYSGVLGAISGLCLFAARTHGSWIGSDIAVGLTFALFLHGFLQLQLPLAAFGLAMAKTFAGFSFSLYVLHFPLLLLIRANLIPGARWQPDWTHVTYGIGISIVVILYSYLIARMTEFKTGTVRTWIRDIL